MPDEPGDARDAAFAETIAPSPSPEIATTETIAAPLSTTASASDVRTAHIVGDVALPEIADGLYRTDHEIARGGMGKIVAAEDRRLGRSVALKVLLDRGDGFTGDALGRFQREALITARLQHPGIVPVYEAGTWPSGEPFFAMKLVTGEPLDRVIAKLHTLEDRLALLPRIAAAADAIAYAHDHHIVHRDLKPANILIGEYGETVVIDWGLAKDLEAGDSPETENRIRRASQPAEREISEDEAPRSSTSSGTETSNRATLTVAGAVMGTPAYMAPEQARGEPVDQRADVFALGAMLYHLLAGVPPYNARTATEVIAAAALGKVVPLAEREPGAPPDLVAIVERAMAQTPGERYPDATALAEELRRFLTGQLVSAHQYTTAQRISRWVRKHRAAVSIGALSIVAFAVFGTLAIRQIVHERDAAESARTLSDVRRQAAEHLIDNMLSDVRARLAQIGRLDLLAALGTQIREYYATLTTIPGGMPAEDIPRMAAAVELIGRAERDTGKTAQALATWSDVRAQVASMIEGVTGPASLQARMMLGRLDSQIGTIHQRRGKTVAALASYRKAAAELAAVLAEAPTDRQALLFAGETQDLIGDLARNNGDVDRAFDEYARGKELRQRAMSLATDSPNEELLALSTSHLKLGSVHEARGETRTAIADYNKALRFREALLESQSDNVEVQEGVIHVQNTLAGLLRQTGDTEGAIRTYQMARPILESLLRRDPTNATWKRLYGLLLADLGFTLLDGGTFTGGLSELDHAIAVERELVGRDRQNTSWRIDLSRSYTRSGDGALYLGNVDDGIARYQTALDIRRELLEAHPRHVPYRRSVAWSHSKLGTAYVHKHDLARAIAEHEKALALRQQLVEEAPHQSGYRNELASSEIRLGKLVAARDLERGRTLVNAGIDRARALVAADPINHEWRETLTQGLLARADVAALAHDPKTRRAALEQALPIAEDIVKTSSTSAQWPVFLAEIHAGLAELAPDAKSAAAEWDQVREPLERLDNNGRLYAYEKPLLERARRGR